MTSRLQTRRVAPSSARQLSVIGYTRRSTDKQDVSHEAQQHTIADWVSRRGGTLVGTFSDDVSGGLDGWRTELRDGLLVTSISLADRPGLIAAMREAIRLGKAAIVVARRDRLARDVEAHRALKRLLAGSGVELVAADLDVGDGYLGTLVATSIDAASELERGVIKQRTRDGLAVRKRRGQVTGSVPFGFRLAADGRHSGGCKSPDSCPGCCTLEPNPDETPAVELIQRLASTNPPHGRRRICTELERLGFKPRGSRWHPGTIGRVLERLGSEATT